MIVFVSNFYNHHQAPFSEAMYRLTKGEYRFIATEPIAQERIALGWGGEKASFVLQYSDDIEQYQKLIDDAEVVIYGSAPRSCVKDRLCSDKLTFLYSERVFKKKPQFWKDLYRFFSWRRLNPQHKNNYMLCASAFTAADYGRYGLYKNACFKWGYFPEVKIYENIDDLIDQKAPASILWVARMIDWKHPELPILVAKRLKESGYVFQLNMIGVGPMEQQLQQMIQADGLQDCVSLLGSMKPYQVREHMENAQIFMFTSDRNEGWGAVLNESMNSGCAVVASSAIGSVPFLMRHRENGLIYRDGNFESLFRCVKTLLDNRDICKKYGLKAYEDMIKLWSADVAAKNFLSLIERLKVEEASNLKFGPCSKADILSDRWFKE